MQVADCPQCEGCPLRGQGSQLFHPDRLREGARVELRFGTPAESRTFLPSLEKQYFKLAGLGAEEVTISHALRCESPVEVKKPVTKAAVRHCDRAHGKSSELRSVLTIGDLALLSSTGQESSYDWRGWLLPYQSVSDRWLSQIWTPGPEDRAVFALIPLGDLYAQPNLTYAMRSDWRKFGRFLRGEWPQPWPGFRDTPPSVWPRLSAFDTEFDREGRLERYSLYDGGDMPWVVEASDVRKLVAPEQCTVIFHNIEADLRHLQSFLQTGHIKVEDSMLGHSVLWSDLPHSLEFLGSLYARYNRWKHLFWSNPRVYSGADAVGTWDVWVDGLLPEFLQDQESAWIYRNAVFPLTPIIMEAEAEGLLVNQERVVQALDYYMDRRTEVGWEAEAYCGFPLNLGSPEQVARWLFEVEGVGQKSKRARKGKR